MNSALDVSAVVERALAEDLGPGDRTTEATVPPAVRARALIVQKAAGVIAGLDAAALAFRQLDPEVVIVERVPEGRWRAGGPVLELAGDARALLGAERTALNLLGHLSGIATMTARAVHAVRGTGVRILDTRKTTPGLRTLEKAAVVVGGGHNHRAGLYDAILIKENHVAMAGGIAAAVRQAQAAWPELPLEVECRNRAEVDEALAAGAARLLLDNMDPAQLRATAEDVGCAAELEASGGITLATLRAVAETGIDAISIGALTHSAPALDVSLLLDTAQAGSARRQ
jgi:nicotinate-nucleotide pyrophosphorylase (carboxylating)